MLKASREREGPRCSKSLTGLRTRSRAIRAAICRERHQLSVLPDLTDQHLKEIGVSLGHRLQLLRAIAELTGREKDAPKAAISAPRDTAERRQVTVMFSDLVGSTALSARMDPEDLREVISAYQKCVAGTVGRFGGFVAKYMGDRVLVYFKSQR